MLPTSYEPKWPVNFVPKDFVQPGPIPSADEYIYFAAYGSLDKRPILSYVMKWKLGNEFFKLVPLPKATTARGSLFIGALGKALWFMSYDIGSVKVTVQHVPGWLPPVWMT